MTELLSDLQTPSDAELISSVRGGDVAAYGELFARHRDAANRLARQLVRGPDADDLVSEAFAKVLTVLQGGGGPDVAFRAYLLTAIRRLHVDKMRAGARTQPSDDMAAFDPGIPFQDTAVDAFESGAAAKAFATLPERWQLVLWHLEVEGQKPADIAPLLGMSPNSVSALAYRAREGLRQAFLTMHLNDTSETDCRWVNEHLGAFVRKGLSNRDSKKVQAHLDQCARCTAMYLELTDVNSNLAGIIAPLLLGGAATGYLASTGAVAGGLGAVTALFGRVRESVTANAGVATAAAVAAGVAAVVTAGALLLPNGAERVLDAQDPVGVTSPAAPSSAAKPSASGSPSDRESKSSPKADPKSSAKAEPSEEPVAAAVPSDGAAPPADETAPPADGTAPADPPSSVTSDVSFSTPVTFDGDSVSFTLAGDPLPPTVGVELVSDPTGIEFRDGSASCQQTTPTAVTCSTGALARGFSLQRGMAAAARTFSASLPLRIPADQADSDVRLIVSVPKGYTDPSDPASNASGFQYTAKKPTSPAPPEPQTPPATQPPVTQPPVTQPPVTQPPVPPVVPPVIPPVEPPPAPAADVTLAATTPLAPTPDADGNYAVEATVNTAVSSGPALPSVSLTVSSAASIVATSPNCSLDPSTPTVVTCAAPGATNSVSLTLRPLAPVVTPTDVTLSVAGPPDYTETNPNDNAGTVTLQPPTADASVQAVMNQNGNSGRGTATADVVVDPDVPVVLDVGFDSNEVTVELPPPCTVTLTGATCSLEGDAKLDFDVLVNERPGGVTVTATLTFQVSVPGHIDPVPGNDTSSVTIERTF